MRNFTVQENIKKNGGYQINYDYIEKRIPEWELSKSDKEQLFEIVKSIKERNLIFAFQYCVFVKKECGHWECLQIANVDKNLIDNLEKGNCTKCVPFYKGGTCL